MGGGSLFDIETGAIRELGRAFGDYTATLPPAVSLKVAQTYPSPLIGWATGEPLTFTLEAVIANSGNIAATSPITVAFYEGTVQNPGLLIGTPQVITQPLAGCGDYATVSVSWPNVLAGIHPYFVRIESADDPQAKAEFRSGTVFVPTYQVYLPLAYRKNS